MSITLEANYVEVLKPDTVNFIMANEDEYALSCMLEFIDLYGEDDFVSFYDFYIEFGERLGYDVCDTFIEEEGICNLEHVEDAFVGYYNSEGAFVEEYLDDNCDIPAWVEVDYEGTWECTLRYDYNFYNGMVFRRDY